ncbi:MAG: hypothetical protein F4Y57_11180 [Acidobacteria bacterium]|nr:hypothetical protein [Acidobacteriota bacterium]
MTRPVRPLVAGAALCAGVVAFSMTPALAQGDAPRTPWGHPDLQGMWDHRTITPLERPEELGDREFLTEEEAASQEQAVIDRNEYLLTRPPETTTAGGSVDSRADGTPGFYNNFWLDTGTRTVGTRRTSLVIDPPNGRLPAYSDAGRRKVERDREYQREHPADSWLDFDGTDRCLIGVNNGPPILPAAYNQNLLVVQNEDWVLLVAEMIHTVRVIPLDGRPALPAHMRQWAGDARGRWEGDTLVVETANFVPERLWTTANPMGRLRTTGELQLVERFTRIDADTLEYVATIDDPGIWSRPWTVSIPMLRTDEAMYEYACHEGNYSMPNMLAGERAREAAEAASR